MVTPSETHGQSPIANMINRFKGTGKNSGGPRGAGRDTGDPDRSPLADVPGRDAIVIELTDEALRGLLQDAADNAFPITIDNLIIASDSTITFMGMMERQAFIDFVEKSGTVLGSIEGLALRLAPASMDFTVKTAVAFDAPAGQLRLEPQKLTIAGVNIPASLVPNSMNDNLSTALTDFFATYGRAPAGISLFDGYMKIYFE